MINDTQKELILEIWSRYEASEKIVLDVKGEPIQNIDEQRIAAIINLKQYIEKFLDNEIQIGEFKTLIDSFNKRNNLWGFTATKGQMFFNQLVKVSIGYEEQLSETLRSTIVQPVNLDSALNKIEILERYCQKFFLDAKDKRKAPNPSSVCYFLSYFWQVFDHHKWPIMYTSLVESLKVIGVWEEFKSQKELYKNFFEINQCISELVSTAVKKPINHWEIEHAFWNFQGNPNKAQKSPNSAPSGDVEKLEQLHDEPKNTITNVVNLYPFVVPAVAGLVNLGASTDMSSSEKGRLFEKMVGQIFKLMSFDVEELGQGSGRNPDCIIKYRENNTAFLVDAKAYTDGYSLGLDDRAIKEYINFYCPKLQKEGYKKIGFIIVSNSFKSELDEFVNDVTWNTEIKRFILLTSEALLYLLAYKTRDLLSLEQIVETMVSLGNPVTGEKITAEYEDV
jgi:hypothetical protein